MPGASHNIAYFRATSCKYDFAVPGALPFLSLTRQAGALSFAVLVMRRAGFDDLSSSFIRAPLRADPHPPRKMRVAGPGPAVAGYFRATSCKYV
jgi:hypothetical protein